ncbi:golgin subfamily A member 4-like isoform X2 [Oncorhynchus keta]|uniref:golgin subfamily A member 4-like isoform X2 n=1 Tax=Oncorhynchus keta TaxID=8018 RepID=UPI00227D38A7|nr:golgin subfamily A member 4-like isoform X2 [Oncorhynchus keta]
MEMNEVIHSTVLSFSTQREESQSFTQKLRVPSVESLLLRGASRAEGLFRSPPKEGLNRNPSLNSLTPLGENEALASPSATPPTPAYDPPSPAYDPPSDIESEGEESYGSSEVLSALSREQLIHRLHRVEKSLGNYRGKYSELVTTYRTVQREKEKSQTILSQSQDKALRRIGELREELQVDQQTKKHLQEEFDAALEEKDQMITVLQTQKSSEEKMAEMDKLHSEALASKEQELSARINQAVDQCKEELAMAAKDKEQQKAAIETESETKANEIGLELETARTRILKLESSLEKYTQPGSVPSTDDLSTPMEELRTKRKDEVTALEEKHCEEMEKHKLELHQEVLAQHNAAMEELRAKHRAEVETILKEKTVQLQAHDEDMNQKTMEKLDVKQTQLEALSFELQELLRIKQVLEERLDAVENAGGLARQELEQRLQEVLTKHSTDIEEIKLQHEQSLGGMEKMLKDELNKLTIVLKEKEKELEAQLVYEKSLKEESKMVLQDRNAKVKELEELRKSLKQAQSEKKGLEKSNAQLSKIRDELSECRSQLKYFVHKLETTQSDFQQKEDALQQKVQEFEVLEKQLQQAKKELSEQDKSYTDELNSKQEEEKRLKKHLEDQKAAHEKKVDNIKKDMAAKWKSQETKMENCKTKTKEMQDKFKKKLQEQDESLKKQLSKKESELQQKEQKLKENILDSQTSSEGLSSAIYQLESNHKEELEKLCEVHKQEKEKLENHWQEKMGQQEEEMQEKHTQILQEKIQEVEEVNQQLGTTMEEKEQVVQEVKDLKEELVMRQTTVQKLQAELKEAAVKMESLSQAEAMFKKQMEAVERNLNTALNERNSFQDQLNKTENKAREKLKSLSERFVDTEKQLQALEASKGKEGEAVQRRLEQHSLQLEVKENEMQKQFAGISKELMRYCRDIEASIEDGTKELSERVESRVSELKDRVLGNQKKIAHLKNVILTKVDRIHTLEKQLQQSTEGKKNLCSSLEQMTVQLNLHKDDIKALTAERESLQREAEDHSQALSEKVICIEQLSEENQTISENVKTNLVYISNLESIINDLKTQFTGSLTGKDEAISLLDQQHKEEREGLVCQMAETIDRLEKEKTFAVEQANAFKNNLTEFKRKAESKFSQNHNTVKSLQTRLDDMEKQISEKDEALQRLIASIDNQSISKSEMDQVLSEKEQKVSALSLEVESCNSRLSELEEQFILKTKESEQLTADLKQQHSIREHEKRELTEHLQQTQEQFRIQNGNLVQATEEKLQSMERENQTLKKELERQREVFDKMKAEILKTKDESLKVAEEKLSKDNAGKVAELKKKAEQKINQIQKPLTLQLEEKEKTVKALRTQLEEAKVDKATKKQGVETLEEKGTSLEEAMAKMKEEQEKHIEQIHSDERLEKESSLQSLKDMYEEKLSLLQRDILNQEKALAKCKEEQEKQLEQLRNDERLAKESSKNMYEGKLLLYRRDVSNQEETKADETVSRLEFEMKLKEVEEEKVNLLAEISRLKEDLLEKTALIEQQNTELVRLETQGQNAVEVVAHCTAEQTKSLTADKGENHSLTQEDGDAESLLSMQNKLTEAVQEKQNLQKYLRTLRKEHQQDLEYVKKELTQENEKKLMLEVEDLEMKHNSSLKQVMREFNTQMALKEQELTAAVKETIDSVSHS